MAEPRKARKRSPSQADRDPEIIAIKQLRDSIADKEAAGEACKGMYQCHKKADKACLDKIKATLTKLKAKSGGGKKKTKARGRSRTRSRSRSRK